jgi:RNA polymerase sigma-70 factor (ECF subfamily)
MSAISAATSDAVQPDEPTYGSFAQLYEVTRDSMYAYVMGLLRDRDAAEDVTAQAFEQAYRKRGQLNRARGDARAWLFGIARNAALDELRRMKRHATPMEAVEERTSAVGDDVDGRIALQQALASLSTRDRELVALKFYAGLNNREIAAVTDQSESNVGTRLSRILRGLRSEL